VLRAAERDEPEWERHIVHRTAKGGILRSCPDTDAERARLGGCVTGGLPKVLTRNDQITLSWLYLHRPELGIQLDYYVDLFQSMQMDATNGLRDLRIEHGKVVNARRKRAEQAPTPAFVHWNGPSKDLPDWGMNATLPKLWYNNNNNNPSNKRSKPSMSAQRFAERVTFWNRAPLEARTDVSVLELCPQLNTL
jgi:hypothetical protein